MNLCLSLFRIANNKNFSHLEVDTEKNDGNDEQSYALVKQYQIKDMTIFLMHSKVYQV